MAGDSEFAKHNQDVEQFMEHLRRASETVRTWPVWKQHVLGELASSHEAEPPHLRQTSTVGFFHNSQCEGDM